MKSAKKTVSKSVPVKKNPKPKNDRVNDNEIIDEVKEITRQFMAACFYWTAGQDDLLFEYSCKNVEAKSYLVDSEDDKDESLVIRRKDKVYFDEDFINKFQAHLDEIKNEFKNLSDKYAETDVSNKKPLAPYYLNQFKLRLNPTFYDDNRGCKSKWIGAIGFRVQAGNSLDNIWNPLGLWCAE